MRNLKRALSMALAAIMVLGLMVVGASATSYEDFTDKDEIKNKEAVNTMVSLGVISGKDSGAYDPTGSLTRAEACTLIARMLGGGKDPVLGSNIKSNFTDTKGHWAETYIAYCANLGIIVGVGDGSFNPDGVLTGTAAAKMVLCALGYKPEFEGIGGANWELATNTLATKVKLYDGLTNLNPSETISRDNVAQLLYNGVQANEVEYRNLQGDYSGTLYAQPVNGVDNNSTMLYVRFGVVKVEGVVVANEVFGLGSTATPAGKARFADANTYRTDAGQQNNYNGVYPVSIPNEYVGQRVVIYVKFPNALAPNAAESTVIGEPILSAKNTVVSTGERLKDTDAVKSFLRDNNLSIGTESATPTVAGTYYQGVKTLTKGESGWNNGVRPTLDNGVSTVAGKKLTFIDHTGDGTVDYIITENPTLAQVTVYNETNKELTIAGEGSLAFKEIANPESVAKGDMVLYVKYDDTFYLSKPETVTGAVTAYISGTPAKVTMDSKNYTASANGLTKTGTTLETLDAGQSLIGNSYTFYLDAYGNVVAKELYEETFGNYALVVDSAAGDASGSVLANSGEVKLMLNDGTTAVYKVNMLASAGQFKDITASTDSDKESAMADKLGKDGTKDLVGHIVTYVVDGSNVTIGDLSKNANYSTVYGTSTQEVKRATASYTIGTTNVIVNDNTLFYVMSDTNGDKKADRYSLIQGLKNVPVGAITGATVTGAAYQIRTVDGHTTNTAKAVVVWDGSNSFKGSREFVYIIGNYTQTQDQIKNNIYEYPAVFASGEKTSILVKNGTSATDETNGNASVTIKSGNIYEYRMNGDYAELFITTNTLNGYVTSQVNGKSMEVRLGTNGSDTYKKTHTLGTTVINVEDSSNVYVMDNEPTDAMSVAYGLNTDGYVSLIFVRDSDVHFRTVTNWTLSTLNINGVDVPSKGTIQVANGFDLTVKAAGGAALASGSKNLVAWADYDGSSAKDEYLKGDISSTTGAGTITMPANGVVKIGSVVGNEFNPSNEPTETVGGSTTPTGEYTITVYTSQWPDSGNGNKYNFYVNNTKVTNFTQGVGTKSFTVKSTDTVAIDGFTFGSVKNNATVTLATGVTGTVNLAATSVTFKVSSNVTLNDPTTVVASATGGDAAVVTPKINTNLTLKTADGTVVSGGTVTKAEIDSSDSNKLSIAITLPEGYTANTNTATVSYVSGQTSNGITMAAGTTTSGEYTAKSSAAASTTIGDGKGTLNITLVVAPVDGKKVSFVLPEGYYLTGTAGTAYSETLSITTPAAIDFTLTGAPDYATKVDVTYTVSGTKLDSTKEYVAEDVAVTSGALAKISTTATTATGDVVVTVTKVVASEVKAEVKAPTGVTIAFENGETLTTDAAGGTLSDKLQLTAPANAEEAKITYTITGATGKTSSDKLTGELTIDATTDSWKEAIPGTFVATGDQAVVVTIDSVTYTKAKTAAVTGAAYGTVDTSNTIATVAVKSGAAFAIEEKDGKYVNAESITLTFAPTNNWTGTKAIKIETIVGGSSTAASMVSGAPSSGGKTAVEITFAAGELTIDDLATALTYVVKDNA